MKAPSTCTCYCSVRLKRVAVFALFLIQSKIGTVEANHEVFLPPSLPADPQYINLRRQGANEVSHSAESAALRSYLLRNKKRQGIMGRPASSMTSVLFPGAEPNEYRDHEMIPVYSDSVRSKRTLVPFRLEDLGYIRATGKERRTHVGTRLEGYDTKQAPFVIRTKESMSCTQYFTLTLSGKKLRWFRKLVRNQYRIHMSLDGLPLLMRSTELNYAVRGYPVGFLAPPSFTGLKNDEYYIYNHLKFTVTYHEDPTLFNGIRVTGFDVYPVSFEPEAAEWTGKKFACNTTSSPENDPNTYLALRTGPAGQPLEVPFSYEVQWRKADLPWADRWDVYIVHRYPRDYFRLVNFLLFLTVLLGVFFAALVHTLKKDIAAYKKALGTGWIVLQGDVFRTPRFCPTLLCAFVGTGSQVGFTAFLTLILAVSHVISPCKMGVMLTALLVLYSLSGIVGGYVAGRLYKYFDGSTWKHTFHIMSNILPAAFMLAYLLLNTLLYFEGAASTASFSTILLCVVALGLMMLKPSTYAGTRIGFSLDKVTVPSETHAVARLIPDQPWYCEPPASCVLSGTVQFVFIYSELRPIMNALWLGQFYYETGYLFAKALLLTVVCSCISIIMCYLQLNHENHRWWWNTFFNGASCGLHFFLFSCWFLMIDLDLEGLLAFLVYFTYMGMISVCLGLYCGAIAVIACFTFTRIIYKYTEEESDGTRDSTSQSESLL